MKEQRIHEFFKRYQDFFRQGLKNEADLEQVASSYATAFIAASPAGVMTGRNDEQLKQVMRQGFERYRRIGTKDMTLRGVRIDAIDEYHCLAHVAWTATYDRGADLGRCRRLRRPLPHTAARWRAEDIRLGVGR